MSNFDWFVTPSCKFFWSCDTNNDLLLGNKFYNDILVQIHRRKARSIFTFSIALEVTFGSQTLRLVKPAQLQSLDR